MLIRKNKLKSRNKQQWLKMDNQQIIVSIFICLKENQHINFLFNDIILLDSCSNYWQYLISIKSTEVSMYKLSIKF